MTDAPAEVTLYDKVGGGEALRTAVDLFYDRVTADPQLIHYFVGIDMARVRRHQTLFLAQALGGPKQYEGLALREAHVGLHITSEDYDLVVGYLVGVLTELSVAAEVIEALGQAVAQLKPSIVEDNGRRDA